MASKELISPERRKNLYDAMYAETRRDMAKAALTIAEVIRFGR